MIPLRDNNPTRNKPHATYVIITLNLLVFWFEMKLGVLAAMPSRELMAFFNQYGILPIRYSNPEISQYFSIADQAIPFISSMFIHGGFWHLLGNMWMLWIFGDNVEDWLGPVRFIGFYLFCGLVAGLIHLIFNWGSAMPTVGASGAIAGVMGAYMFLYPRAKVLTLVPIFFFIQIIELPALIFLGFWFFLQLVQGTGGAVGNVAWWAHIGGFVAGAAVVLILSRGRYWPFGRSRFKRR